MHVLFIGGTGLISTAIARQLLEAGHQVTLFNRGKSQNRLPEGAQEMRGDRKDYAAFERAFEDKSFDVAVDMVAFQPDDSASAVRALKGRVGQFIHCSTVCVYSGPVTQIPTTETEPYHSIGDYGKNKIKCEELLLRENSAEFPVTIMRPSHSYGEGGQLTRSWGAASSFIGRMRAGKPIVVQGDGTGLWASCHVDDVARGFIATMGQAKCFGQAYNITGEQWLTWDSYYEQVAQVTGGQFEPVHIPTETLLEAAPKLSKGTHEIFAWPSIFDTSKLKRDTNYAGQTISWQDGVRRAVNWMEANNKMPEANDDYEDRLIEAWRAQSSQLPHQD